MASAIARDDRLRAPGDASAWVLGACAISVVALTLVPLAFLVQRSVRVADPPGALGLAHYASVAQALVRDGVLRDTLLYAGGSALVAFAIGATLAWLVAHAAPAVRRWGYALALVPLVIPGVLFTVAWMLLASPRIGLLNLAWSAITGSHAPLVDVYSLAGMVVVTGLHHSPLAFLLVSAALRAIDPALEEAGEMSGASPARVALRITLPLAWPATLAALLLVFVRAIESLEVPALIGLPAGVRVLTSALWEAAQRPQDVFGAASAYAVVLLAFVGAGVLAHGRLVGPADRFATLTGRIAARPADPARGRGAAIALALYLGVVAVLPVLALAWASLQPWHRAPDAAALATISLDAYRRLVGLPAIGRAALHSVVLGALAATLVVVLGVAVAWLVQRTRLRGRRALDALATLPVAMPGLVIGLALALAALSLPFGLYGTLAILLLAYVTRFLPYGARYASAALAHVDRELEDAAQVAGVRRGATIRRIVLPLVAPGLLAGWLYVFVMSARELSSSILLYGPGTEVLAVVLWELWENGQHPELAALGVLVVVALVALVAPLHWVARRFATLAPLA